MSTTCPKCHTDNPDDSKFCKECATPFPGTGGAIPTKTIETPYPQFKPGTSLANRYEIISELGKGGMGEVYLAEDTNLKRQVAVKVLPQPFALDKERLARFEREARLLASLNHTNIATIHGLEKSNGQQFLVMELVEGDTLAERIKKGPVSIDETLEICRQIAEGLESAHEKGIIHRDLKPANIKITPEGKVKVLDFGIAKAFRDQPDDIDSSKSPTITDEMTEPGMIIGTAAYMSPEQAKGKSVDKRTDIWAFGCILFECLTGKRVFGGDTSSDTIASILKGDPEWTNLSLNTPKVIRLLLSRCLQKDTRKRLHDIADARIEIEEAQSKTSATRIEDYEEEGEIRSKSSKRTFPWTLATLIVLATVVITSIAVWNLRPAYKSEPKNLNRFSVDLPVRHYVRAPLFGNCVVLSPNGKNLVFPAFNGEKYSLYLRPLDQLESTPIPGTDYANHPFFSPDGQQIGFCAEGKLKKVYLTGGRPITVCEANGGATWTPDGTIIIGTRSSGSGCLMQVSASGGTPKELTTIDESKGESGHRWPEILPGGKNVLFTIWRETIDDAQIAICSLDTGQYRVLLDETGFNAHYVETGHIVYVRDGVLMAVPFDIKKLEVTGSPVALPINVRFGSQGAVHFSISSDGTLVYLSGRETLGRGLVWVDREGNESPPLKIEKLRYYMARISPDGKKIALSVLDYTRDIWIYDIEHTTLTPFSLNEMSVGAAWTPDGERIIFCSEMDDVGGISNIYSKRADSSGEAELLFKSENGKFAPSLSADGSLLAFHEMVTPTSRDIRILRLTDNTVSSIIDSSAHERAPSLSPDGKWIAYRSDESGRDEIYVSPVSEEGGKLLISTDGGTEPLWSRDGRELFYRNGVDMMAVPVETVPSFKHGNPKKLFETVNWSYTYSASYDIHPDGDRFMMIKLPEESLVGKIHVVINWIEELKRLVPTEKRR